MGCDRQSPVTANASRERDRISQRHVRRHRGGRHRPAVVQLGLKNRRRGRDDMLRRGEFVKTGERAGTEEFVSFPPTRRSRHTPSARQARGLRHSIGLTLASMKSISSESSPYLAYNCWSISGIGLDQLMSEEAVKSCTGTYFQVLRGLCCVTFNT